MTTAELAGWMPIRVYWEGATPMIDWCRFGEVRCTDAFFEQTIARALRSPARLLFRRQTPATILEKFAVERPGVPPTGFIFHLSRSGATLVTQMLAALTKNIVIAEAPPIDRLLNAHRRDPRITRERRIAWLRGLVDALARPRFDDERHLFVRFNSWHLLELPLLLEAFPDVPWIFLYRDPLEVMRSQHRRRGMQMTPGVMDPGALGIAPNAAAAMTLNEYCARVLMHTFNAAAEYATLGRGRMINFRQLPQAVTASLADAFGLVLSPSEIEQMERTIPTMPRNSSSPYSDDVASRPSEVTEEIRRLTRTWLAGPYEQLERVRLAQESFTWKPNQAVSVSQFGVQPFAGARGLLD